MQFHPIANIFPMLEGADLQALADDIKAHGQREPIWIYEGKILDGRNRWKACEIVGTMAKSCEYTGDDPLAFVISLNLHRRHLNESQRGMIFARITTMERGRPRNNPQICGLSQPDAAKLLNVSMRTGQSARVVIDKGTPALVAAVDSGKLPVSAAAKAALLPADSQRKIAARVMSGTKPTEAAREIRRDELSGKTAALPNGKHRVIYADPPWKYGDTRAGIDGMEDSAAEGQYPTMSVQELIDLPVADLAADDCVLFCWATFPLLPDALEVVRGWGFKYKTAFVWSKVRPNFGHYHNANAELLLVCTRGSGTPEIDKRESQVQTVERTGRHSEKPEEFRGVIDRLYPTGSRIELFRRGAAPKGWKAWGNESR